jgi:MoaA/NifB/PqqE/SkfB family radical SAM enzyme
MAQRIVSGFKVKLVLVCIWLDIIAIIIRQFRNPSRIYRGIMKVFRLKKNLVSKSSIKRLVKVGNRYYWDFNQPGWPSKAFRQNITWFSNNLLNKGKKSVESVRLVFLAITKQCPMNCEHCYEWDEINKPETITIEELNKIVAKYQALGTATFIIGGGEPMSRYDDLIELLRSARPVSDFWISTSGYQITPEKAKKLKEAGLSGVCISVDHYDEAANNNFRGHKQAMKFVREAAANCLSVGLGVATALCATREFISMENLIRYAEFTRDLGSGFIWLIEPRAEGRYQGMKVELEKEHFEILDEFYLTVNNYREYRSFPRVLFPNYNHRHIGCAGAGTSNIMIDTDGYINPCPFCRKKIVHALAENSETYIRQMVSDGCFKFITRN